MLFCLIRAVCCEHNLHIGSCDNCYTENDDMTEECPLNCRDDNTDSASAGFCECKDGHFGDCCQYPEGMLIVFT